MIVTSKAELEALPDGTLITWLRIPGDSTSEAVAFVRREGDVTWISPGGWEPQTIEAIGITYPVQVVRMTLEEPPAFQGLYVNNSMDVIDMDHGGTWAREKALEAAARVYQGMGNEGTPTYLAGVVTNLADQFVEYLDPPTVPEMKACIEVPFSDETPPCGDANCLSNCAYCVASIDAADATPAMSNEQVTEVVEEVGRRLLFKGHTAGHLSDAMEAVRNVLGERFQ